MTVDREALNPLDEVADALVRASREVMTLMAERDQLRDENETLKGVSRQLLAAISSREKRNDTRPLTDLDSFRNLARLVGPGNILREEGVSSGR